jgi:hypothetical protein
MEKQNAAIGGSDWDLFRKPDFSKERQGSKKR